jgi:hypothetical protein
MTTTYYVKAQPVGQFAQCSYFSDPQCTQPVAPNAIVIPATASACQIAEAEGSDLALLGASYKTLGHAAAMTDHNFDAAIAGTVSVSMPTNETVTKGVVLIFSNRGAVSALYPSSDPEVSNGDQLPGQVSR